MTTATATAHRQASKGVVALSVLAVILASPFYGFGLLIALIGGFTWLRGNPVARWVLIGVGAVLCFLVPYLIINWATSQVYDTGPVRV
ncbi:MAG: hypothetical protein ACR2JG_14540 [Geodermatophilaceae bacterium]